MATKTKSKPNRVRKMRSTKQPPEREKRILALIDKAIAQQQIVRVAEHEVEAAKEERKAADKALEAEQEALNAIIDEIEAVRDGKPLQKTLPLSDAKPDASKNGHADDAALLALGLSDSLIEKLGEAEIVKVSDLEKAMNDGRFVPNRIKGIGQTAVDKVTDALMKWRGENPVKAKEGTEPDAPPETAPGAADETTT